MSPYLTLSPKTAEAMKEATFLGVLVGAAVAVGEKALQAVGAAISTFIIIIDPERMIEEQKARDKTTWHSPTYYSPWCLGISTSTYALFSKYAPWIDMRLCSMENEQIIDC